METYIVELRLNHTSGFEMINSTMVPYTGDKQPDMRDITVNSFDGYLLMFKICGKYLGMATLASKFNGSSPFACTKVRNDAILALVEKSSFEKVDKLEYVDFDKNDDVVCFRKILRLEQCQCDPSLNTDTI